MSAAGNIIIRAKGHPDDESYDFTVEVHTEDETAWGGYSRLNPFAGFSRYPKAAYILVEDQRPK